MKELIAFLLLWIGAETNYNVNLETPRVVQLTQQELNTMYYTEDTHPSGHLHAFYDPKTDTIYLNKYFNITSSLAWEYDVKNVLFLLNDLIKKFFIEFGMNFFIIFSFVF